MKETTILSLFSGYDSPVIAMRRLGHPYRLLAWCEIEKAAIKAHNILHPSDIGKNLGDITTADPTQLRGEAVDILFYSSPCQDLSRAGTGKGGEEGTGTRSSLLWYTEEYIRQLTPRYLIMENVPTLLTTHKNTLKKWLDILLEIGYHSSILVITPEMVGLPQYRPRLFVVSSVDAPPLIMTSAGKATNWRHYLEQYPDDSAWINPGKIPKLNIPTVSCLSLLGYSRYYLHNLYPELSSYHVKHTYNTITCKNTIPPANLIAYSKTEVRRLTTRERLRIMGLRDDEIDLLQADISNTALDRLAGNSIVIPVAATILEQIINNQ